MYKITSFLAQNVPPINNPALPGIANKTEKDAPALFGKFIAGLIGVMLVIGTLLAFAQLLQGGLAWITSGGDKTALEGARDRIINALIGLLIVFAAWALYVVILRFLGISLLGDNGVINLNLPSLLPGTNQ